jgi:hypothetical protein
MLCRTELGDVEGRGEKYSRFAEKRLVIVKNNNASMIIGV